MGGGEKREGEGGECVSVVVCLSNLFCLCTARITVLFDSFRESPSSGLS